jgi:hypothetical protein
MHSQFIATLMKPLRLFCIIVLLCGQLAGAASTPDLVQALQAVDPAARHAALIALESRIAQASAPTADAAQRAALERELLGYVASAGLPDLSRAYLIRLLPPVASDASMQLMLKMVTDASTSRMLGNDAASLIAILAEGAPPDSLLKNLLAAPAPARELLWAAVALRADARLAKPLVQSLRRKKLLLDDLAIQTLGAMGGRDAAAYLFAEWKGAAGPRRTALGRAIVHTGAAKAAELKELCRTGEAAEIRVAALRQWARLNEKAALAFLQSQLEAGAADSTALIAVQVASGGSATWKWITQQTSPLSEAALVTVLQRIREQQRKELEPWVLQRLAGAGEPVELAAIRCLEVVGGGQSTEALLARIQSGPSKVSTAAMNTLAVLQDSALDTRLKGVISDPEHPLYLAAYELIARRNSPGSTVYFNQLFAGRTPVGKELTAGLRGMERLGNVESVKLLLARLQAEQDPATVRAIQISIKRVVIRLDQPDRIWGEAFSPALKPPVGGEWEARVLPLLDAVASKEALDFCIERVKGPDATLAAAAEQALIRWRNLEVCDYWLAVINDPAKSNDARDQAVRFIDLTLRSDVQKDIPRQVLAKAAKLFLATENQALRDKLLSLIGAMEKRWKAAFHKELSPHLENLPRYREQIEALIKKDPKQDK